MSNELELLVFGFAWLILFREGPKPEGLFSLPMAICLLLMGVGFVGYATLLKLLAI